MKDLNKIQVKDVEYIYPYLMDDPNIIPEPVPNPNPNDLDQDTGGELPKEDDEDNTP